MTPDKDHTSPPNNQYDFLLPFENMEGSFTFEKFCREVCKLEFTDVIRAEFKEKPGVSQFGVDIEGFNIKQEAQVVISCKRYKKAQPNELIKWTKDFTDEFETHWRGRGVRTFVLAVTIEGNSDKINKAVRDCCALTEPLGILFKPWFKASLTDLAKLEANLVVRYFGNYWNDNFNPKKQDLNISDLHNIDTEILTKQVGSVSEQDRTVRAEINRLKKLKSEGNGFALRVYIEDLYSDELKLAQLNDETQSIIFDALCINELEKDNLEEAENFLLLSKNKFNPKDRTVEAWLKIKKEGYTAAISFLDKPQSSKEYELLAALQIDEGLADQSKKNLEKILDNAEKLRLKSAWELLYGSRENAVELARQAVAAEPNFRTRLIFLCASLANGLCSEASIQISTAPDPFNPALALHSKKAIQNIETALLQADFLIENSSIKLKEDIEVWRYAILACHPQKGMEAYKFGEELINRPDPSAQSILWCFFSGIKFNHQAIKKLVEGRLKKGVGAPTDAIVSALLTNEAKGSEAANKVIQFHLPKFTGKNRDLLELWAERFTLPDNSSFSDSLSDNTEITVDQKTPEQIIAIASFYNSRDDYASINALREQLLKFQTPWTIECAATAAFNGKDYEAAIEILENYENVFLDSKLPSNLDEIKIYAHERLGQNIDARNQLEKLAINNPSAHHIYNHIALAQKVADRPGMLSSAKKLSEASDAVPEQLLTVAHSVKSLDKNLADELVKKALKDSVVPSHIAPMLLGLESSLQNLGGEFNSKFQKALHEHLKTSDEVLLLDEDSVIDLIEKKEEEKQSLRIEWLLGRICSHVYFSENENGFLRLFLDPQKKPEESVFFNLPRLTTSYPEGNVKKAIFNESSVKPKIALDISALLLMHKYNLFSLIDDKFQFYLPGSLPPALLSISNSLDDVRDVCKEWLFLLEHIHKVECKLNILVVLDDKIPHLQKSSVEEDKEYYLGLFGLLKDRGLKTNKEIENACAIFSVDINELNAELAPPQVVVSQQVLLMLIEAGCVFEITNEVEVQVDHKEWSTINSHLSELKIKQKIKSDIEQIIDRVNFNLEQKNWHSLPEVINPKETRDYEEQLTPLRRVLSDLLIANKNDKDMFIWVEDRSLSRYLAPHILNLNLILEYLVKKNGFSKDDEKTLLNQRLEVGYSFLSLPLAYIYQALLDAFAENGEFSETKELKLIQSHISRQILNLKYVDLPPNADQFSALVGEVKHATDLHKLAPTIILKIWQEKSINDEQRAEASQWVWTNLRVDSFRSILSENYILDNYTGFKKSLFVLLISNPLLEVLQTPSLNLQDYRSYFGWLFGSILSPRLHGNPSLWKELVKDTVQKLLSRLTRKDFESENSEEINPKDLEKMQADSNALIKIRLFEMINTFPEVYKQEIFGDEEISELLSLSQICNFVLPDGEVNCNELANKVGEAIKSLEPNSSAETYIESTTGDQFKLSMHLDPQGIASGFVSQKSGEHVFNDEIRVTTFPKAVLPENYEVLGAKVIELPTGQINQAIDNVLSVDPGIARINALEFERSKDFTNFVERLDFDLKRKEPPYNSFLLPNPDSIANYLLFELGQDEDIIERINSSEKNLIREFDYETAFDRLSASPFVIKSSVDVSQLGINKCSIKSVFTAQRYLCSVYCAETTEDTVLQKFIKFFNDATAKQMPLFCKLVEGAFYHTDLDKSWAHVNDYDRLHLIWVWADRVSSIFACGGYDTIKISENVAQNFSISDVVLLSKYKTHKHIKHYAHDLNAATVNSIFCSELFQSKAWYEIGDKFQVQILSASGFYSEKVWQPYLSELLYQIPSSIPLRSSKEIIKLALKKGIEVSPDFKSFEIQNFITGILGSAEKSSLPHEHCYLLHAIDKEHFETGYCNQIFSLLESSYIHELQTFNPKYIHSLYLMSKICGILNEREFFESIILNIAKQSSGLSDDEMECDEFSGGDGKASRIDILVESIFHFIQHSNNKTEDDIKWAFDQYIIIAQFCPKAKKDLIKYAEFFLTISNGDHTVYLSERFHELRV